MDRTKPLGAIKDLTTGTLGRGVTIPGRLAARAFGVAKGAASVGKHVAQDVAARRAAAPAEPEPSDTADATGPVDIDVSEPVNVVEELGLDPAPVDEPEPASPASDEPLTSIDAQADPETVDVTPADVADQIGKRPAGA
ncbi:MAG TPA: hypothetical protein VD814_10265 [Nocardioides sp.]|nr:hypothetical protein [Nocardioides sp.]